jgi:glycosyltransferase involved in cell wall biosynthesis
MSAETKPLVSIIIPCFNEAEFIEQVLFDIGKQSYPKDRLEVLVVDGGSQDDTQGIIKRVAGELSFVQLLHNPDRFVPQAMNLGIQTAKGSIIIRLDAHASYPTDYVENLVTALQSSQAANVGGVWQVRPRNESAKAQAIAYVLTHRFGIGNADFRTGVSEPLKVDTVPFGCFWRSTFEQHGLYDERLHRNQDIELNKRIAMGGGTILLFPHIHSVYLARDTYGSLWKNNFANGRWVILTAFFTGRLSALSIRHFVPFLFVSYLLLLLLMVGKWVGIGFWSPLELAFLIPLMAYAILLFLAVVQVVFQKGWRLGIPAKIAFLCIHVSYGLGSWRGILDLLSPAIRRQRNLVPPSLKPETTGS